MLQAQVVETTSAAEMDMPARNAYVHDMFGRFITMLAILAIALVATATSGHASRMDVEQDHALQVGEMTHASVGFELSCDGDRHCRSAVTEICEFACASLSAFLTSPDAEAGYEHGPANHDFPSEASHVSLAPELNERPPKLRLV